MLTTLDASGFGIGGSTGRPVSRSSSAVLRNTSPLMSYSIFCAVAGGPMLKSTEPLVKFATMPGSPCEIVTTPRPSGALTALTTDAPHAPPLLLATMRSPTLKPVGLCTEYGAVAAAFAVNGAGAITALEVL